MYDAAVRPDRRFTIGNPVLEQIFGGWEISGVLRLQTGRPFLLTSDRWTVNQYDSGVVLNGITVERTAEDGQGVARARTATSTSSTSG